MILRRICQLMLTRITHQVSHIFDLNKIKNNFILYLKRYALAYLFICVYNSNDSIFYMIYITNIIFFRKEIPIYGE